MVNANWDTCFKFVLQYEGGYDNNPKDRGNWTSGKVGVGELKGTKYGIASFMYPGIDIKNLSVDEAGKIYSQDYWPKVSGSTQPSGVDLFMFDTCVNNGAGRALSFQRKVLNANLPTARELAQKADMTPDKVGQIKKLAALRGSFYEGLSTFNIFGKGWMRRNAAAEAKAVSLAMLADNVRPDIVKTQLSKESKQIANVQKNATAKAAGSGGAGFMPTQDSTPWHFDWWTFAKIGVTVLFVCVVIYFIYEAIKHNQRSKAYAEQAKG